MNAHRIVVLALIVTVLGGCHEGKSSSDGGTASATEEAGGPALVAQTTPSPNPDYVSGYPRYQLRNQNGKLSPDIHTPRKFTKEEMNLHYGDKVLNYYTSKLADVESFLGANVRKTGDEHSPWVQFDAYGTMVRYDQKRDFIVSIDVETTDFNFEKGGKVGMTREEIRSIYVGGFEVSEELKNGGRDIKYYYVLPDTQDTSTNTQFTGFLFDFYDSDTVTSMGIGGAGFAED